MIGLARLKSRIGVEIDIPVALLDAGHGGMLLHKYYMTAGKRSPEIPPGVFEGEFNRLMCFDMLNAFFEVGIVGEELIGDCPIDVSLKDRIKTINKFATINNNCISISNHLNAATRKPRWCTEEDYERFGSVIFYKAFCKESKMLAECINEQFNNTDIPNKRGIKPTKALYMIRRPAIPAVLIEHGFMDSKWDISELKRNRRYRAELVAKGSANFYNKRVA